jgi:hypothetical protein
MARADSLAGRERRASLLAEKPSPLKQAIRVIVLVGAAILIFSGILSVAVLLAR